MPEKWCTVTVVDRDGRRYSLDVQASSTYDAAHLYVAQAKRQPQAQLPIPTRETVFEVVTGGMLVPTWTTRSIAGFVPEKSSGDTARTHKCIDAGRMRTERVWGLRDDERASA